MSIWLILLIIVGYASMENMMCKAGIIDVYFGKPITYISCPESYASNKTFNFGRASKGEIS